MQGRINQFFEWKINQTNNEGKPICFVFVGQTFLAINEVTKQMMKENPGCGSIHDRLLVLSIGTGSGRSEQKYNAKTTAKWGLLSWLFDKGSSPIIQAFYEAGADMVDYQNSTVFQSFRSQDNYLRLQVSLQ